MDLYISGGKSECYSIILVAIKSRTTKLVFYEIAACDRKKLTFLVRYGSEHNLVIQGYIGLK